jgi:hypothetical protein
MHLSPSHRIQELEAALLINHKHARSAAKKKNRRKKKRHNLSKYESCATSRLEAELEYISKWQSFIGGGQPFKFQT